QRAAVPGRSEPFLYGDRGGERPGPEQIVAAAVPRGVFLDGVSCSGLRFLRQARQRIELADDADDRLAGAVGRDERRRDVGDAGLHLEAGVLELLLQQRAALRFLETDFGEAPDLLGDRRVRVAAALDPLENCRPFVGLRALEDAKAAKTAKN